LRKKGILEISLLLNFLGISRMFFGIFRNILEFSGISRNFRNNNGIIAFDQKRWQNILK
jgi:hypothetical protein